MIRKINKKDLNNFLDFCSKNDKYRDFYITENNKRKYLTNLKVSKRVFKKCLKFGDKGYIKMEDGDIVAFLMVTGFSDNFHRKYVTMNFRNKKDLEDLFRFLKWKKFPELYIKVKKKNKDFVYYDKNRNRYKPTYPCRKCGFYIKASRGEELLLTNKDNNYEFNKHRSKSN